MGPLFFSQPFFLALFFCSRGVGGEEGRKEGEKERKQGGSKAGRKAGRKEGGGFRFVYFAMSSGTWQQNGFGGVHNTAKEPPSFLEKRRSRFVYFAMSSGTWQQNGFGGVHNTAKEPLKKGRRLFRSVVNSSKPVLLPCTRRHRKIDKPGSSFF